ncbi:AAA family ATPase [Actinosynnema mirum]|uniref:Uncharacterized protein n=1 Tax=Actinosynnema mirum (strain ATCC 29888 / DSM 43827 / JCM 3225 / NBRC 14064 / NCIMB 13271 / NRRL B-12336 / IMRU 3971 / 101) TaxID=446462 RepID=C6WBR0_ACTMD|nr:AAA family ATPase [Actinosynnema mirum]ACU37477.1 hypothetical protein Amir_3588 [Actinosynnema mirum DSM 43827]
MPRLILLNGPPACGKSTVARRYADEHPLALDLDVDLVRALIGRWRDARPEAGLLARAIALAAARTHLAAGHDVVVPQLVARPGFLTELEDLARATGAVFHEIVLLDGEDNALRRYAERETGAPEDQRHDDAAEVAALHDRLTALLRTRPRAKVVPVVDGDPDATYRAVLAALG